MTSPEPFQVELPVELSGEIPQGVTPMITNSQPENFITTFPIPNPPSATAATSMSSPPKTLWMGDIDPYSDEESISQIWKNMGRNVLVKLIKAKKGTPAASLNTGHAGYCFIEFKTYDEAKMALSLNGSKIPNSSNRVFRLNWASSATLSAPVPQSPEYSLFVGDLAPTTTEAHLLSLFQAHFKTVKTVRVMTDPTTGASRCFGFVRFSDEAERHEALNKMQGVWCAGRPLRVALATPRNANISNVNAAAAASMLPGAPTSFSPELLMYSPYNAVMPYYSHPYSGFQDPTNTTVFIGGLPNTVNDQTLLTLFQPFGSIISVKIPQGKGCGFVKFSNREDAEAAISAMQGYNINGSRVRLSWGRSQNQARSASAGYQPSDQGFYPQQMPLSMDGADMQMLNPGSLPTDFNYPQTNLFGASQDMGYYSGGYYQDFNSDPAQSLERKDSGEKR